ncbi:MAG: c-type cytochrome [Bacteroidota bacterium]
MTNTTLIYPDKSDSLAGLDIVKRSDCVTCHKVEEKLIGPSFTDIAKKYALNDTNMDKLSSKIINGGNGSWGRIPMTPHPSISVEIVKSILKYIFSLKKQNQ